MTKAGNLVQIAKVLKSNGTDGELVMSFLSMDPGDIKTTEPVFIYFDGLPVPFFIQQLSRRGQTKALVHLNDVENFDDAEELVGQAVYIVDDEDGEYDEGDFSFLVGWTLFDGESRLGEIVDFIDIPANPCIEIESGAIIPLHEDLIQSVDEQEEILVMTVPAGLLD